MTFAIQASPPPFLRASEPCFFLDLQDKANAIFAKIKDALIPQAQNNPPLRLTFNFRALFDRPGGGIGEGVFWGAFWAMGAYFAADSIYKLYNVCVVENATWHPFEKIGSAVKTAFVKLLSLGSSTAYLARWAHAVEVISLGQYLPLVKNLCYGCSIVAYTIEAAADVYTIFSEGSEILKETSVLEREKHQQWLSHAFLKLISDISIVAWAALGLGSLAGIAISPLLMGMLLVVGCVTGGVATFYKMHIEKQSEDDIAVEDE
jgi:hypothetical protein